MSNSIRNLIIFGTLAMGALLGQSTNAPNAMRDELLASFQNLIDSSAVRCEQQPKCFCVHFEATNSNFPLRFSRAQYCPLSTPNASEKIYSVETWDDQKNKIDQGFISNGELHGQQTMWHPNGRLASTASYNHGKRTGPFVHWHDNGQISHLGQYIDDKEDGQWLIYSPDGKLVKELVWSSGKLVSKNDG